MLGGPQVSIRKFWSISWAFSGYFAGTIPGVIWFFPSSTSAALKPEQFSLGSGLVMKGKLSARSEGVAPRWLQLCPWLLFDFWHIASSRRKYLIHRMKDCGRRPLSTLRAPAPTTLNCSLCFCQKGRTPALEAFALLCETPPFAFFSAVFQLPNFWDVSVKWSSDTNKCCF